MSKGNKNEDKIIRFIPEEEHDPTIIELNPPEPETVPEAIIDFIDRLTEVDEELIMKRDLLSQVYHNLAEAIEFDGHTEVTQVFDLDDGLTPFAFEDSLVKDGDRIAITLLKARNTKPGNTVAYLGYLEATGNQREPYDTGVMKVESVQDKKILATLFNYKRRRWEKTKVSILDIPCGPIIENRKVYKEPEDGVDVIKSIFSHENASKLKIGLTKEQLDIAEKLGQVYNENMGVVELEMRERTTLLRPIDKKWKGLAIGLNDKSDLTAYFYLETKHEIANYKGGEFGRIRRITHPIKTKDASPETMSLLIQNALKERRAKHKLVMIPLSEDLFVTGKGKTVQELLDSLDVSKVTDAKDKKALETVISMLEKIVEEEIK